MEEVGDYLSGSNKEERFREERSRNSLYEEE